MLNFSIRFKLIGRTLKFSKILLELIIASDKWDQSSLSQHLIVRFKYVKTNDELSVRVLSLV